MHEDARRPLDPIEARRIAYVVAGELGVDVRSVRKVLRGEHVRGVTGERIRLAVTRLRAA